MKRPPNNSVARSESVDPRRFIDERYAVVQGQIVILLGREAFSVQGPGGAGKLPVERIAGCWSFPEVYGLYNVRPGMENAAGRTVSPQGARITGTVPPGAARQNSKGTLVPGNSNLGGPPGRFGPMPTINWKGGDSTRCASCIPQYAPARNGATVLIKVSASSVRRGTGNACSHQRPCRPNTAANRSSRTIGCGSAPATMPTGKNRSASAGYEDRQMVHRGPRSRSAGKRKELRAWRGAAWNDAGVESQR